MEQDNEKAIPNGEIKEDVGENTDDKTSDEVNETLTDQNGSGTSVPPPQKKCVIQ